MQPLVLQRVAGLVPPQKLETITPPADEDEERTAQDLAQSQPVITVDDTGVGEGKLFECDELNNTAVWPDAVCPTVEPG
ncbi:hypothetical protein [Nannocystis radixulma]|uniref:Uncharacterized protein n=1 Tax=Nannocystis radixulma TaxID=2995305 RepID=A0ABT5BDW0_9BACT|nr:hypothetical protein [Nannocystis radixulma]MDC0672252.1 hypothetical protein [Nannocystis radixulma]